MSQSLPKTDSREFAVADTQEMASVSATANAPDAVQICVRIWSKGLSGFEPARMSADHPLTQMISDLLVAGGGTLEAESEYAVLGWFPSPALAVTSSRRVQRCVDSFSEDLHSSAVGIGLRSMPVTTEETASSPVAINFPEVVRAGRIAVIGDLWQKLEEIPGLRLRRLTSSDRTEANIRELVWNPTPQRVSLDSSGRADQEEPTDAGIATGIIGSTDIIPTPPDVLEERRRRLWIYGGLGCAAVLILTFSVLIVIVSRRNAATRLAAPSVVSTAPQLSSDGAPTVVKPVAPTNDVPPEVAPVLATQDTAKSSSSSGKSLSRSAADRHNAGGTIKAKQMTPVSQRSCATEGFSSRDIENLLVSARRDYGNGDYLGARRAYEKVKCLDPNNDHYRQEADKGIAQIDLALKLKR